MYKFIKRMIKEKSEKMQSQKQAKEIGKRHRPALILTIRPTLYHLPKTYGFLDDLFANKSSTVTEHHD